MKKILILPIFVLLIASCGTKDLKENMDNGGKSVNQNEVSPNEGGKDQ